MAGLASTVTGRVTGLSVALLSRTIGVVTRAVIRVDEYNLGLTQRNAWHALEASRAWRKQWEES